MNRHHFKVIFSKSLGQLTVVSEHTAANGKAQSESTGNSWMQLAIKPLAFALMCSMGATSISSHAQIVADPNAAANQRATILNTASGKTQINIQTPSAAGVSMNQYKQFDVNAQGAILNNARTNANTQTAGMVQGNPWLANGGARVIVNQVNSANPSYLNGYIEVAGQRAEVIIANPAGININGGGFINASGVNLTTGTPVISGFGLDSYRVQQGQINIDGQGLDTRDADYTNILARSARLNGGIWANDLTVITGANQISATNQATPMAGQGTAPTYAIDTAALGGMYAGKITLIGTEQGLGVNNAGQIAASAGSVVINNQGQLTNSGLINSNGAENVTAINASQVNNSGTIAAQGNAQITAPQLTNSGTITAGRETQITSTDINNSKGLINGARIAINANSLNNTQGTISQTGSQALTLNTGSLSNSNGGLIGYAPIDAPISGGNTSSPIAITTDPATTPSTASAGGTTQITVSAPVVLADGIIQVAGMLDNNAGQITGNGGIDLSSSNGLVNAGTLNLNNLAIKGAVFDNSKGTITTSANTDIQANQIINQSGKIGAAGNLNLAAGSLLNNTNGTLTAGGTGTIASPTTVNINGTIASNEALNITGNTLDNQGGTIAAIKSNAALKINGALNNTSGTISAANQLNLNSQVLNNSAGQISAAAITLNTNGQALNNTRGTVAGNTLEISSGALTNEAGLIQGTQTLKINTNGQALSNSNSGTIAGITSGGSLDISAGALTNSAGYIGSKDSAIINASQINNANASQISSQGTLNITSTDLTNSAQIESMGNATLSIANTLNNNAGLIRSGSTLSASAASLINSNTQGANQGIEAVNVKLTSNALNNQLGLIRADESVNIINSGNLNNTSGIISAAQTLTIADPAQTLAITNTGGTLIAGKSNTIQAKSLTGDGQVQSNQDLAISLVDNITNNQVIQALGNLSLTSAGTITNNNKIIAGGTNTVSANIIDNSLSGEISGGNTTIKAADTVTNRGLIDGGHTKVTANTINNLGTGRIYGDHISIGAGTLTNRDETVNGENKAAVIAARDRLDIGAGVINNFEHGLLMSVGDMAIGGSLDAAGNAVGRAGVVNNESATIESGGNMSLAANVINNKNMHFALNATPTLVGTEHMMQVQGQNAVQGGSSNAVITAKYDVESQYWSILKGDLNSPITAILSSDNSINILAQNGVNHLGTPEGIANQWDVFDFDRYYYETSVASSDPSQIIAGGNLTLDTNLLENNNSKVIVGGALQGTAGAIKNTETMGERYSLDFGLHSGVWYDNGQHGVSQNSYANGPSPKTTFTMNTSSVEVNAGGNNVSVGAFGTGANAGAINNANAANAAASVFGIDTTNPTLVKTGQINTNLPNNSLFVINPNRAGYLIETDPRFTNSRQWLSSDYMITAFNLDPANMHKRLGDGYYEQKLIREQVAQLTGRRYLDGYSNDDEQYKALMNAGVTAAGQFNLRPGIALTPEQMARLTADIVWLVEQEITLADGTKTTALVPKIYVAVKPGDIDGSGSLIAANQVNLKLNGNLDNSGTLAGRNVMQITANNINNSGRITADLLSLNARTDLNNIGGLIDATSAAQLSAGRDINITTTTSTGFGPSGSVTAIDRVAGIYVGDGAVGNTLILDAGRNVNLSAAQIANDGFGNSVIRAGNDINLGTVKVGEHQSSYGTTADGSGTQARTATSFDVGSSIDGLGNISMAAGNNLTATAANVNSVLGTVHAVAGNDLTIQAGKATSSQSRDQSSSSSHFMSSSSSSTHNEFDQTQAIESSFGGDRVILQAGNNVAIKGSSVISDSLTYISGKNVAITSVEDTSSFAHSEASKKSGFTSSFKDGVASVGYGKSSNASQDTGRTVTQHASSVGSYGDTTIKATDQVLISASDVAAGNNLTLIGKDINLLAAQDTDHQTSATQSKKSGVSIGVTYDTYTAAKSAYDKNKGEAASATGTIMNRLSREFDASNAAMEAATTPVVMTASSHKKNTNSTHDTSTARVSSLTAGNNLTMIATDGSITSQGAQMSAEGNALLIASDNITLGVAHNTESETRDEKSSGFSFDNRGGKTIDNQFGIYKNKSDGSGSSDTVVGSLLSVGGNATLATTKGDIRITGSDIVAGGNLTASAAHDLIIESAQNTTTNQNTSNNKAVGKVVISDTERFSGYHNEKHKDKETTTTQVNSSLASLNGNINLYAGNDYKQIASNVIAGNDVNITAQTIDITTAQNTGSRSAENSDLKIGQFARVMSPIIDLINNIDSARASDGRVKDMQIMAAAANAYQIASAANSGAIFSAEVGTGFAVNRDSSEEQYSQAIASTIKGGGNVNITSTTGDIHAKGANIEAGKALTLDSARDILLEAGESTQSSNSKNSNYGLEVGTGIAVGAQTGWYFYGQVQAGKGQSNSDGTYYSNSQLVGDSVNLISKGNTTLKGAHAIGNTVTADVGGKLAIESLQDKQVSDSNQTGVSLRVQVAFGTAWSASGSANQAKSEGNYTAVNQQSGLFAGNGGYHVKADSIDLKGGAISSTNAATSELVTNSLTHSDLVNSMSYSASTAGVSGGYSFGNGGGEGGDSSTPSGSTNTTSGANPSVTNSGKGASFNASMPMNKEGGSSSSTLATLTDGNITIGGVNMSSAKDLGLNTNGAAAHAAIDQIPDLQKILADQQAISTASGTVIATSAQIASDKVNAADADKKQAAADLESAQKSGDVDAINAAQTNLNQATANAKDVNAHWGTGGDYSRALSAVTSVLVGSVAGQGGAQIAGNALAPYAAQVIGETFDHTDNPNKAAQLLSHAILGATLAYVNGGNVATGAAVGAGSELAAQYLIENLYGDDPQARNPDGSFNANLLSEDKKQNIVGLTSAIGALVGGTAGGGLYNAAVGGNVAANAVVNNGLLDEVFRAMEAFPGGTGVKLGAKGIVKFGGKLWAVIARATGNTVSPENIQFTVKTLERMNEPSRAVPVSILSDVINSSKGFPDPQQSSTALAYYSQIVKNGKLYNIKVLYNQATNQVEHFHYSASAMGPLPKIGTNITDGIPR